MLALDESSQPFLPRRNHKGQRILFSSKYTSIRETGSCGESAEQEGFYVIHSHTLPNWSCLEAVCSKGTYPVLFSVAFCQVEWLFQNNCWTIYNSEYIFQAWFWRVLYKIKESETSQVFLKNFIGNEICHPWKSPKCQELTFVNKVMHYWLLCG